MGSKVEKLRQQANAIWDKPDKTADERWEARKMDDRVWELRRKYAVMFKGKFKSREAAEKYIEWIKSDETYFITHTTLRALGGYGWGNVARTNYFVTMHGFVKNDETWEDD